MSQKGARGCDLTKSGTESSFGNLSQQRIGGSPLNSENQTKVLDTVSRVFRDAANALGREHCSYEEGIRFIRDNGNRTLFDLLLEIVKKMLPEVGREQDLTPEAIPYFLDAMETRQKAADFLTRFSDPDPAKLNSILHELDFFLPSVRKVLVPFAKTLRQDPGGHPRKIKKEEEPKVLVEITELFNEGLTFPDAKKEVGRRRNASPSTIERICRRGNLTLEVLIEALRAKIK